VVIHSAKLLKPSILSTFPLVKFSLITFVQTFALCNLPCGRHSPKESFGQLSFGCAVIYSLCYSLPKCRRTIPLPEKTGQAWGFRCAKRSKSGILSVSQSLSLSVSYSLTSSLLSALLSALCALLHATCFPCLFHPYIRRTDSSGRTDFPPPQPQPLHRSPLDSLNLYSFTDSAPPSHTTAGRQV